MPWAVWCTTACSSHEPTASASPAHPPTPAADHEAPPSTEAPAPPPNPCAGISPSEDPPLALRLVVEDQQLKAIFCSRSAKTQRVLNPQSCIQHVHLTLAQEQVGLLARFDRTSVASCSSSVPASAFSELAPGGWLVAGQAMPQPTADGTLLEFGWFRFPDVPAGPLKANATFHSRTDRAHDVGTVEGVWMGRLETTLDVVFDPTSGSFQTSAAQR